MSLDSPIALAARDRLPETWDALSEASTFGDQALERRLNSVMNRVFNLVMDDAEQEALDPMLVEYLGIRVALELIIPGIDYWSKQAISHSAGERESKAYKDRAEDLKALRSLLVDEAAKTLPEVEVLLPLVPRRASDTAKVVESGTFIQHVTADPMSFPPMYGLPEETTTG
jgi:hypothetical protein